MKRTSAGFIQLIAAFCFTLSFACVAGAAIIGTSNDSNATANFAGSNSQLMLAQTSSSQDMPGKSIKYPPPDLDNIIAVPNFRNPLDINFFPINTGGPVNTWSWTFGDSGTSNVQNPTHLYKKAGTYTVTLTVSGPGGTDTKSINISVRD